MPTINPKKGKDKILMFRKLSEASSGAAAKLALQIEHTITLANSVESRMTKDGKINTGSGLEATINMTAISSNDEVNLMLMEAVLNNEKLEVWEVDFSDVQTTTGENPVTTYGALYMQGNLENWELPADSENFSEFTSTFKVDGKPQSGRTEMTVEQVEEVQYAFRDVKTAPSP